MRPIGVRTLAFLGLAMALLCLPVGIWLMVWINSTPTLQYDLGDTELGAEVV